MSFPCDCEDCESDNWQMFGCGFNGFLGKGTHSYTNGATEGEYAKTCPQYCLRQNWVQEIMLDLPDYKRAAMGPIQDMESHYLDLLRVAENEVRAWESENEQQMMESNG